MKSPSSRYRRLTPDRRGLLRRSSLWLGDDHLLAVTATGYTEEYRRYRFGEIQGIVTLRSRRREWLAALFAVPLLAAASGFWAAASSGEMVGASVAGVFALLFLSLSVVNLLRGPSCRTWIQTSVSLDELPSLARTARVADLLETIGPRIASAQGGGLRREDIPLRAAGWSRPAPGPTPPQPPTTTPVPKEKKAYGGTVHRITFVLLLADAALTGLDLTSRREGLQAFNAVFALALLGFLVAALVLQYGRIVPRRARVAVWVAIVTTVAVFLASAAYGVFAFFSSALSGTFDPTKGFSLDPMEHPFLLAVYLVDIVVSLACGGAGLLAMERVRQRQPGKG